MVSMKRVILAILFIVWSSLANAELTAELSELQVSIDETFKLTITQENVQDTDIPDLTPLQADFNILGTERSINYTLIDGQANSIKQWTILLSAKRKGKLTIPAITIGQQSTKPLTVEVTSDTSSSRARKPTADEQQKDVLLTTEISSESPYVNQQVIYTVKLYTSRRLLDAEYQGPQIEDALLIPLGNAKRYQTMENNRVYAVEEQRYAIFPQKSGHINIASPVFKALVYDVVPQRVNVRDKNIQLSVKPIPDNYKGKYWLPAEKIHLSEHYDKHARSFIQGDTLTRTITIEGAGIPAQLMPKLNIEENGQFNIYPEKPEENNIVRQQQLVGTTTTKITYLFSKAAKITIPELRLKWFNTITGKEATAHLPSRTIEVTPAAVSSQTPPPALNTDIKQTKMSSTEPTLASEKQTFLSLGWILAILFALAWFITLLFWFWQKRNPGSDKMDSKSVMKDLQLACQQNDAAKAKACLLKWSKQHWPEARILNLADLSKQIRDSQLKKQINLLCQSLYSHNTSQWQGDGLWRALLAFKNSKPKKSRENPLPPIHPQGGYRRG
ncbi:protein BatD [Legionella israelensis]|nr:protein BatD [Legionella israelensis]